MSISRKIKRNAKNSQSKKEATVMKHIKNGVDTDKDIDYIQLLKDEEAKLNQLIAKLTNLKVFGTNMSNSLTTTIDADPDAETLTVLSAKRDDMTILLIKLDVVIEGVNDGVNKLTKELSTLNIEDESALVDVISLVFGVNEIAIESENLIRDFHIFTQNDMDVGA